MEGKEFSCDELEIGKYYLLAANTDQTKACWTANVGVILGEVDRRGVVPQLLISIWQSLNLTL